MMRCIIDEAESWKGSNPELVLPDAAEPSATSEMEGIASATVHAADSLSESSRFRFVSAEATSLPQATLNRSRMHHFFSFRPKRGHRCCERVGVHTAVLGISHREWFVFAFSDSIDTWRSESHAEKCESRFRRVFFSRARRIHVTFD